MRGETKAFIDWCASNGHAQVVAKDLRRIEQKQNRKYRKPRQPKKNFVNDKREYYRTIYLKTEHWRRLKTKKLDRTPFCEKCGATEHLDAHHLRYKSLYDVTVYDLQTLCRACHTEEHKNDKPPRWQRRRRPRFQPKPTTPNPGLVHFVNLINQSFNTPLPT